MSETIKSFELPRDEELESRITHWEVTLSNASHAVYVAQRTLETLYRQRYEERSVEQRPAPIQPE